MHVYVKIVQNVKSVKLRNVRINIPSRVLVYLACLQHANLEVSDGSLSLLQDAFLVLLSIQNYMLIVILYTVVLFNL